MSIDFESKPFYGDDDKYVKKRKKKEYSGSMITTYRNKKVTKEKIPCKFL